MYYYWFTGLQLVTIIGMTVSQVVTRENINKIYLKFMHGPVHTATQLISKFLVTQLSRVTTCDTVIPMIVTSCRPVNQ